MSRNVTVLGKVIGTTMNCEEFDTWGLRYVGNIQLNDLGKKVFRQSEETLKQAGYLGICHESGMAYFCPEDTEEEIELAPDWSQLFTA